MAHPASTLTQNLPLGTVICSICNTDLQMIPEIGTQNVTILQKKMLKPIGLNKGCIFLNILKLKGWKMLCSVPFAPKLLSQSLWLKKKITIFLKGRDSPLWNLMLDELLSFAWRDSLSLSGSNRLDSLTPLNQQQVGLKPCLLYTVNESLDFPSPEL